LIDSSPSTAAIITCWLVSIVRRFVFYILARGGCGPFRSCPCWLGTMWVSPIRCSPCILPPPATLFAILLTSLMPLA
jgi:hypothetical protein